MSITPTNGYLRAYLEAIDEIAKAPINPYETDAMRFSAIRRLSETALKKIRESESPCPYCGEPYYPEQPRFHDRCHLIEKGN